MRPPDDLNALNPEIWATGVTRDPSSGAITVRGLDVRDLAAQFGSPTFVMDEDDVRARMREWRSAFGDDAMVFYAGKAFLCTELARWVDQEGLGLDVCTAGELGVALRARFPVERLAFHGNNKSTTEINQALEVGVGRIVVDSFEELARVAFRADELGVRARILIRVTVGVEASTHEYVATAHEDQKFGFSIAGGAAAEAVRRAISLPSVELLGLHSHIGSQIFDTGGFEVSAHRVVSLAAAVRDEHGVELPELNLGGGLGIAYVVGDDPVRPADMAARLKAVIEGECAIAGLSVPAVAVEPGRAIVGPSTLTLYEVGTVKELETDNETADGRNRRTYVSVDGGMSDNLRTALYDAEYTVALASRLSTAKPMLARVVGKHCETGDVVVKDAWLPGDLAPGDLVAVAATGAYCRSLASNYNLLPRPPVIAVRQDDCGTGSARVLLRRENEDDLMRLDSG